MYHHMVVAVVSYKDMSTYGQIGGIAICGCGRCKWYRWLYVNVVAGVQESQHVTAMPVFSSDVQQYMICKRGGAHGFVTMHHTRAHTHTHTHTPPPPPPHNYKCPQSQKHRQKYLKTHSKQARSPIHEM